MNYKSFSTTAEGMSHKRCGAECEDYSTHCYTNALSGKLALAVIADGHGAEECCRSAVGAMFAAKITKKLIIEFTEKAKPKNEIEAEKQIKSLVKSIIKDWRCAVENDITENSLNENVVAYGTTLIACAITANYWFGIHIGDGRFTALYKDGSFDQPVPWDDKCFLNITTSICDDDAAERARIYFSFNKNKIPAAIFLCSDGIDDNYPEYENEKHLFKLYRTIALTFCEEGFESTCAQLKDLAAYFANNGKCDDTSIAGIIDMDAVKKTHHIWQKQIAKENVVEIIKNKNIELPITYGKFIKSPSKKYEIKENENNKIDIEV